MSHKPCRLCNVVKPFADFYPAKANRDGFRNDCIECFKTHRAVYNRTARVRTYKRDWARASRATGHVRPERDRSREPRITAHEKARVAVNNAVKCKRLPHVSTLKCSGCGKPANQYHHHHGYAPKHHLDVVPLCAACHGRTNWKDQPSNTQFR